MPKLIYGEWLPDQPDVQSPGMTVAQNVMPGVSGYRRIRGQTYLSSASVAAPSGAFAAKADDDSIAIYVGDVNNLYKFNAATIALDVKSRTGSTYSTTVGERWWFTRFKGKVYATNYSNELQSADLASSGLFADASGSPPRMRYIAVVRDFLVGAFVNPGSAVPYRVRWTAIDNPDSWTIGTDQADQQDLADGGHITGLTGGEFGLVLLERGIYRMTYAGPPIIFQFDRIAVDIGCAYPGTVAQWGGVTYFASRGGFHACDGQGIKNIGAERIDRTWLDDLSPEFAYRISAAIDPVNKFYCIAYPSNASVDGTLDQMLIYSIALDKWSRVDVTADCLAQIFLPGVSGDSLDLYGPPDTLDTSPDSSLWIGGAPKLGGTRNRRLYAHTGESLMGTLETGDAEIAVAQHSLIRRLYPVSDSTVSVQVASRRRYGDAVVFGTASTMNADGWANARARGRYHRIRTVHSGSGWTEAVGTDIDYVAVGRRGDG